MLAIGMYKGKPGAHKLDLPKPEITKPDDVLIKVKQAGVDGTDFNMIKHNLQDPAEGQDKIVMGHEMVGVVEAVGNDVKTIAVGDTVVLTVRRGCGICQPCLHNQSDMCMTGLYTERGIHKKDGFFTEYIVDQEQYAIKVPNDVADMAVFTEPLSIAEKGVEQIRLIQSRMPWACEHPNHSFDSQDWGKCKTALVVGAGPLGILATALLRLADVFTYVVDIVQEDSPKVHLVKHMGANYIDGRGKSAKELVDFCCTPTDNLDIVFEASGAAVTAVELINYMSRSSIYVMTGIPRQEIRTELDAAQLVRQIVRNNQVVVGSVNSNRSHFEMALKHIPQIEKRFSGMLKEMITHRFGLADHDRIFDLSDTSRLKTVIDITG
ncbi:MAG: alcohol dehydrogenase catalytic domain-containing protein [Chloroflexi bacterium]|jgi:glucose 1-dehydrogenase|nr:alcohol dehydrogenase catalytic domain-containing protein [Chloroflexota bacterium]MBT7080253.1 alcohol dehydrogenase catalytic domain-containing protein [Chloroflexota bacterium]MBT7289333.1 alcohol dehydrogenase catalytic domain-containing protein [Chloroflexota bacterium]